MNLAGGWIRQPRYKSGDSRFSGAGLAYDSKRFAGSYLQINVVQSSHRAPLAKPAPTFKYFSESACANLHRRTGFQRALPRSQFWHSGKQHVSITMVWTRQDLWG